MDELELLALQIHVKVFAGALIPDWNRSGEAYRHASMIVAALTAYASGDARVVELAKQFIKELRELKSPSIDDVVEVCSRYWKKTGGVIDFCV